LADPAPHQRRISPDHSRDLSSLQARVQAAAQAHCGNCGGQQSSEFIAHLVVALSRYLRHLRAEGGREPTQMEELIGALTDGVRVRHGVTLLDLWRAAYARSAMPKRLLITKSDAAELLGVSLRTIERLISAGRLPLVHVEGAARVRVSDLEAYVQGLKAEGGAMGSHRSLEARQ
jgi:excisionase family DNA binding protein